MIYMVLTDKEAKVLPRNADEEIIGDIHAFSWYHQQFSKIPCLCFCRSEFV